MSERHVHTVFVTETVSQVVKSLQSNKFDVVDDPESENPECKQAHIGENAGTITNREYIGLYVSPDFAKEMPEEANTCIAVVSTSENFEKLKIKIAEFTIIKDCHVCAKVRA